MYTKYMAPYLEEKPLEHRSGVWAHVFNSDMGKTVKNQQREASNWLEPLATHKKCLLRLLSTKSESTGSLRGCWELSRNAFQLYKDINIHNWPQPWHNTLLCIWQEMKGSGLQLVLWLTLYCLMYLIWSESFSSLVHTRLWAESDEQSLLFL